MSDFDFMLHRQLRDGKEFEALIPKTFCKSTPGGNGGTDLSMKLIKEVSDEYSWQMEAVAKVLQKNTLESTCIAIHDFAYWHHQYRADDDDQLMRSPACSWHDRKNGIDCKSYSIIASSILSEMELVHYIRKIKQPGMSPNDYTHVYVVVPKDQETGDLRGGHFTIDGTLLSVQEPSYLEKTDLKMEHHKLNAPGVQFAHQGLNGGVDLSTITGLFSSFGCIGGSAFTQGSYETTQRNMIAYFDLIGKEINDAILAKNQVNLAYDVNEFYAIAQLCVQSYERKLSEGWNGCTTARIKGMIAMSKFYRDTVGTALRAYMSEYFIRTDGPIGRAYKNSETEHPPYNFNFTYTGNPVVIAEPNYNYAIKPTVASIPRFEITPYVVAANGGTLNPADYLKTLTNILANFLPNSGGGGGTGTGGGTVDGGYYNQPDKKPDEAGFGIIGWAVVAAGLAIAFTQMPDKPLKPAAATKTAAPKRKSNAKK